MKLPSFAAPNLRRSRNMAAIRSRNTSPELYVRRMVHRAGFRYRLHSRLLPGSPDLSFKATRIAVFVHGCFWHGHACNRGHTPRTNNAYWTAKICRNRTRDELNAARLKDQGSRMGCRNRPRMRDCSRCTDLVAAASAEACQSATGCCICP